MLVQNGRNIELNDSVYGEFSFHDELVYGGKILIVIYLSIWLSFSFIGFIFNLGHLSYFAALVVLVITSLLYVKSRYLFMKNMSASVWGKHIQKDKFIKARTSRFTPKYILFLLKIEYCLKEFVNKGLLTILSIIFIASVGIGLFINESIHYSKWYPLYKQNKRVLFHGELHNLNYDDEQNIINGIFIERDRMLKKHYPITYRLGHKWTATYNGYAYYKKTKEGREAWTVENGKGIHYFIYAGYLTPYKILIALFQLIVFYCFLALDYVKYALEQDQE